MLDLGRGSIARRKLDPPELARAHWVQQHMPYLAHVADDVMVLRDGDVMAAIVVEGLAASTAEPPRIDDLATAVAAVVANAGPDVAFYVHRISNPARPTLPRIDDAAPFAQAIDDRWQAALQTGWLRERQTIVSVLIRPRKAAGLAARLFGGGAEQARAQMARRVSRLDEIVARLMAATAGARPERLTRGDGRWLGLYRALVTGRYAPLTPGARLVLHGDLVAASEIRFDGDAFVVVGSDAEDMRFGAVFGVKKYSGFTEPGMLDRLNLDVDMALTHSFTPVNDLAALERIQRTVRQMASAEDAAVSLRAQLEDAADDLASQRTGFGLHHASVAVFCRSMAELEEASAAIRSAAQGAGVEMVRESLGARATVFAQHPGNASYRLRPALISTRNFADLTALHGGPRGASAAEAPWGEALTIVPTASGEPYRLNLHLPAAPGERSLGHTAIFGRTGSGKTLFAAFLMASAQRVGARIFAFDKDQGLETPLRALGGAYAAVRMGEPAGFNPFAVETDARGAAWLTDWISLALLGAGPELTPLQAEALARAARANGAAGPGLQTLGHFRSQLRAVDDDGDLHERLGEWDEDGRFGWLFSGAEADSLDLSNPVTAFDLTEVLDSPRGRTAWLSYVFRRIERAVEDGRPTLIVLDEAWKLLDDAYFQRRLKDWMLTMRKKNVVVMMLTQRVGHVAESAAAASIFESLATTIVFPNARNTAEELAPLGLNEAETRILMSSAAGARLALVRAGDHSALVDLDLSGLGGLLGVLGGGPCDSAAPDLWKEFA
jgi:type IV secretion system protein VirB4